MVDHRRTQPGVSLFVTVSGAAIRLPNSDGLSHHDKNAAERARVKPSLVSFYSVNVFAVSVQPTKTKKPSVARNSAQCAGLKISLRSFAFQLRMKATVIGC